jgi:nicotinamide-nucleotide adenylyltransferase
LKKILFIGRFQPLHNGHVEALKQALASGDFLLVGVGSSQASNQRKNPYSYQERKHMLELALDRLKVSKKKYRIIPIPDLFNDKRWAKYVLKLEFDEAFSGSHWVKRCLKGRKPVRSPKMFNRLELRATLIRNRMRKGLPWSSLVPAQIAAYLKGIGGQERIRKIYGKT